MMTGATVRKSAGFSGTVSGLAMKCRFRAQVRQTATEREVSAIGRLARGCRILEKVVVLRDKTCQQMRSAASTWRPAGRSSEDVMDRLVLV